MGYIGPAKEVIWLGDSLKQIRRFPEDAQRAVGYALYFAQKGDKHKDARPMRGFGGASVLEIVERFDGDTYRAVYTVQFESAIYVLHAFQKKSKRGIATPKEEMELVRVRLKQAEERQARIK